MQENTYFKIEGKNTEKKGIFLPLYLKHILLKTEEQIQPIARSSLWAPGYIRAEEPQTLWNLHCIGTPSLL